MSSGSLNKSGSSSRLGQGSFFATPSNSQNHLLEKVNARTSTPDSEALASSEDEGEHRYDASYPIAPPQKATRRPSWLNDTSQPLARPRKGSFASGSMSPTGSNPTTPSADAGTTAWGSSSVMGRGHGPPSFSGWGSGIWNSERKDPPSRLTEVLPSPTSTVPPGSSGIFGPDNGASQTSPKPREPGQNSQIPFAIPLHPTPKTYRSQSYSVGQMELDSAAPPGMSTSAMMGSRSRHPALQHRPSRPSMLSEMANDGSMLGKVNEVDNDEDEESVSESMQGSFYQASESQKTIEALTRENAMLRQQQQQQQQQYNARLRPRASTGYINNGGYSLQETVPEESDYAIDELDESGEIGDSFARRAAGRRMSEFGGAPQFRSPFGGENRKTDSNNLKKALWSTSGFNLTDISQSRRHSFANMPTRQGSISSIADTTSNLEPPSADGQQLPEYATGFPESAYGLHRMGPSNFDNRPSSSADNAIASFMPGGGQFGANIAPTFSNPQYAPSFGNQPSFSNRAPSPHRNLYSVAQPRHNQLLHIVLFKCARADVFYIQEGTGLNVKPGDLVIVEADRGTDLGTVAHGNVDWQNAKDLKEHYAEEHYKWLMMYSQGASSTSDGTGAGLLASANGFHGSAIGGMGPTQHHMQEPNTGELRPKLIKRLASSHEVSSLRDKEGQEAKAKRVCMQKVKEHCLHMEILDAEFQMDWKKLTFYYFAEAYINFNSLVTDLFKIYKTRIWMSAINPASFASPTLGIQAPSGVGPGAVNASRAANNERRQQAPQQQQQQHQHQQHQQHQQQQQLQEQQTPVYGAPPQGGPGPRGMGGFGQPGANERGVPSPSGYPINPYAYVQPGAFGAGRGLPAGNPVYPQSMPVAMEGFPGAGFQHIGDIQSMRQRFAQGVTSPTPHSQQVSPMSGQSEWAASFQSLSLNSH